MTTPDHPPDKRPQGRPAADGAAMGREGLIRRTCELLREVRPADLSRAELARRAGVDPSLIRYYFKDRDTLLQSAGAALSAQLAEDGEAAEALVADADPSARLLARIQALLRFVERHPNFPRLMMDELRRTPQAATAESQAAWSQPTVAALRQLIDRGHEAGAMRDVDGALLFIAMIGAAAAFAEAGPILAEAFGAAASGNRLLDAYQALLLGLVERGLADNGAAPEAEDGSAKRKRKKKKGRK